MVKVELKMGKYKWSPKQEEGGSVITTYSETCVVKGKTHSGHVPCSGASLGGMAGGGDERENGELSLWNCEAGAGPGGMLGRSTTSNARCSDDALPRGSREEDSALPWPAPSSFSVRETQLDFSKLLGKESQENYFINKASCLLLQFTVEKTP